MIRLVFRLLSSYEVDYNIFTAILSFSAVVVYQRTVSVQVRCSYVHSWCLGSASFHFSQRKLLYDKQNHYFSVSFGGSFFVLGFFVVVGFFLILAQSQISVCRSGPS